MEHSINTNHAEYRAEQRNVWWLAITVAVLVLATALAYISTFPAADDAARCIGSPWWNYLEVPAAILAVAAGVSAFIGVCAADGFRKRFAICLAATPVVLIVVLLTGLANYGAMHCSSF